MATSQPQDRPRSPGSAARSQPAPAVGVGQLVTLAAAWVAVGLPLAWGVLETLRKTMALFQ